jgi:hypothetical protein
MSTENENTNYDFQSFDPYPQAQMYPTGWDLSEMQSKPKADANASNEEEA